MRRDSSGSRRRRGVGGVRGVLAVAGAVVLAVGLGPAARADGSGGLGGGGDVGYVGAAPIPHTDWTDPVVTRPDQPSLDKAAGQVCPFPVREEFPVNKMVTRTWNHADGSPAYSVTTGDLKIKATNLATGRTVTRDIGGSGAEQWVDGKTVIFAGDHWSANMTASFDTPHRLIVASDFMSLALHYEPGQPTNGTLLALIGPYEDLCETLAGKDGHHGGPGSAYVGAGAVPHTDWQAPVASAPGAGPRDYAAGEVCPYPVHLTFPVNGMRTWSWSHADGSPAYSVTTGDLKMRATNASSGASVVRDIGGTGQEQFLAPGVRVQGGDHWGGIMTSRYRPAHHLQVATTYMSFLLAGGETDYHQKEGTLLTLAGHSEDLCATLGAG